MAFVCWLALLTSGVTPQPAPEPTGDPRLRPYLLPGAESLSGYGSVPYANLGDMDARWQPSLSVTEQLPRQWERVFVKASEEDPQPGPSPRSPTDFPWLGLSPSSDTLWPEGYEVIASRSPTRIRRPAGGYVSCGTGREECEWGVEEEEEAWVNWLSLVRSANSLWLAPPSTDSLAIRKRVQSVLASDRLDHHKREEILRAIKPGMAVRDLHHALGVRADNALILIDRTVSFALGLVIAHDGAVVWEVSTIEAHVERDLEASYYRPGFNLSIGLLR